MIFLQRIKSKLRSRIVTLIRQEVSREVASSMETYFAQFVKFLQSPPEKKQSFHELGKNPKKNLHRICALSSRLCEIGITVKEMVVDVADFKSWLRKYDEIDKMYNNIGDAYIEKCLEHYISYRLMGLQVGDVFVDVAASNSPFASLIEKKEGVLGYRLDLAYKPGISGRDIGANAAVTGLPDGFADGLALHCAYECFAGDADTGFVKEAARLLKPKGRLVILPLYIDETHFITTSPFCDQRSVPVDLGAIRVWRDDEYVVPFSRHYSPDAFFSRVYSHIPAGMSGEIYFIKNLPELMSEFPEQRIYCFFVFLCKKQASIN